MGWNLTMALASAFCCGLGAAMLLDELVRGKPWGWSVFLILLNAAGVAFQVQQILGMTT